ncbi:MAG TPA: NADH-quinone oxidoreductase subunit N [Euryarchaeota archaeon]|nr:NADH-quinone oxidoreductase subunit N [Euryarchaeota archaeon]
MAETATAAEYFGVLMPQILLLIFALLCPALDLWLKMRRGIAYWVIIGLTIVGVMEILALIPETQNLVPFLFWEQPPETSIFAVNAFSMVFTVVFVFVGALVAFVSPDYIKRERNHGEYYALLLIAVTGMSFVATAGDLIVIFLGLEIAGISSYALTGFQKSVKRSTEAAMKYFIVGGFSSAISLFGMSLLYGAGGTTNLTELGAMGAEYGPIVLLGIAMLIIGLGFKIAAVPFHMWAPDVYEGAPTSITALLAAASKKMGIAALFKIFIVALLAYKAQWDLAIGIIAILTMTVGNLVAIQQNSVKRMLAYSSIAQAGYILIALPVWAVYDPSSPELVRISEYAVAGGILHVITHAAMKSGAFFVILALTVRGFGENLKDFDGLSKRAPFLALAMAIFVLSLAGIPPLAGFYSKFVLFSAAIFGSSEPGGASWLVWLAIAGILNSALSLFYYARIIKSMYIHNPQSQDRIKVPPLIQAAIVIAMIVTVFIGLYPEPFLEGALEAARALNGLLPIG